MCSLTNPRNIPVITSYERSEDAGATQEKKNKLYGSRWMVIKGTGKSEKGRRRRRKKSKAKWQEISSCHYCGILAGKPEVNEIRQQK